MTTPRIGDDEIGDDENREEPPTPFAAMICQNCHKNQATVTVVEILPTTPKEGGSQAGAPHEASGPGAETSGAEQSAAEGIAPTYHQERLCEICAQSKNLPQAQVVKKTLGDIWKLLQTSGATGAQASDLVCPECGMSREEFRRRGRVGCAKDYELFRDDVHEILERVHGAIRHRGRLPGVSQAELSRQEEIDVLEKRLAAAIRDEAYESAARIRDELSGLQGGVDEGPAERPLAD